MPLTPQDVRAKLFTSVRFKVGYDEDEVDAFLDQVESDLGTLYAQIDRLTTDLAAAQAQAAAPAVTSNEKPEPELEVVPEPALAAVFEPDATTFAPVEEVPSSLIDRKPESAGETGVTSDDSPDDVVVSPETEEAAGYAEIAASAGAVATSSGVAVVAASSAPAEDSPTEEMLRRTLILAQRTADALISEARAEAETLVADARAQAEQIERTASSEHALRQRDRQAEHDHLNGLVEQLRGFESEYRSRLRAYLHLQLRDLESSTPAEPQQQLGANSQAALYGTPAGDQVGESPDPASEDSPQTQY